MQLGEMFCFFFSQESTDNINKEQGNCINLEHRIMHGLNNNNKNISVFKMDGCSVLDFNIVPFLLFNFLDRLNNSNQPCNAHRVNQHLVVWLRPRYV